MASEESSETDLRSGESRASNSCNASPANDSRKKVSIVLKSYGGCVKCCSFSADGALLASGSTDNLVRVWRVRDRVLLHSLKGHKNWVLSLAFSPVQEANFATTSADGTVRLWDLSDAAPQSNCTVLKAKSQAGGVSLGSSKDVTCCSYNALGTLLCTGGADKLVRIWSLPDGTCQRILHGHRGQVNCVAFQGGTGRLVASVEGNASFHHFSSDNALILWDLDAQASRELLTRLSGHKRRVNSCSFNGSGALIATGGNDNTVRLWMLSPALQAWGPGEEERMRSECRREEGVVEDGSVNLNFGGRDSGSEAGSTTASVSVSASARGRGRADGEDDYEIEVEGDSVGGGVFGAAHQGGELPVKDDGPAKATSASSSRTASSSLPCEKERIAQCRQDTLASHTEHSPSQRTDSALSHIGSDDEVGNEDRRLEGGEGGGESSKSAEWVQLRTPFRVEARILDLTPPNAPINVDHNLASHAASQVTTTTAEVLGDDGLPLFSVMADFGRVCGSQARSHEDDVSRNPPSEPPSTGIEMKLLDVSDKVGRA